MRIAEPIHVEEIQGGRYDGAFRVRARCAGCYGDVVHIIEDYGPSHRVADCELRLRDCEAGYDVVRPMPGMLRPHRWWESTPGTVQNLGFGGRPELFPKLDTTPEAPPEGEQAPPTLAGLLAVRMLLSPLFERGAV